mgnify:FL=1|jgi:hypothetical protein
MLRFENVANVGDMIKALDFRPMDGRPDSYLVGRVIEKGEMFYDNGVPMCHGYKVYVTDSRSGSDRFDINRVGIEMIVPFEMSITEFDGRVQLVA